MQTLVVQQLPLAFPDNPEDLSKNKMVNIHLRKGFREVGRRERIGKLAGIWRDTVLLERRSQIVGL